MTESRPLPSFTASGFFALRTPLLAFDALVEWARGVESADAVSGITLEDALKRDRRVLRERLMRWVADPVVREALFLASPVLDESLGVWASEPESERGQKVERSLVRYFARMAGRATPFGLFAGLSVGRMDSRTRLCVSERSTLRRHTRLDMDYVCALVEQVRVLPEVRDALLYVPNTSLYRAAGRWRYLEMRVRGRERSYHLVGVEPTPYLDATLEAARDGAKLEALAAGLVASDPEVSLEEALTYLETLVAEQLLVPTWAPPLTGPEPVPYLLEGARDVPGLAPLRQCLSAVHETLSRMDAGAPGHAPELYRELARGLEVLPTPIELPRLFQVDTFRPVSEATLGAQVVEEMLRGVQVLQSITPPEGDEHLLNRFRTLFLERYENRAVPLMEALDEEGGIGFALSRGRGTGTGPLLAGFLFPGEDASGGARSRWESRHQYLLRRLEALWASGLQELVLTPEDLEAMKAPVTSPLPDAFGVVGTVVARSAQAVDQGEFQVTLEQLHGPSGALYLGRFCHGDPQLERCVREHLRAEEALRPDAVFAEIVHLPQGRMGNVICRPQLRRHDIAFLGQSGAERAECISVADLWVSVEGERVVLRSRRLGKEVIPRLSNAHNYASYGLGVYRFLCMMQNPHRMGLRFQWGPLGQARFLPRVVHGRTVLSLATWRVDEETLRQWRKTRGAERFAAVQHLRARLRLPRWVRLVDEDNRLPVDLDNVLSVETFVHLVKDRSFLQLEELFPGPDALCVEGGDGHYVHEVVVPFVRQASSRGSASSALIPHAVPRRFPPGSEWLYLKLYGGSATLDRLMSGVLGDTLRHVLDSGAVDRWFFLRYEDPNVHLRLRFHGTPARLESEVWPALRAACEASLEEGTGWRVQLDTYEREVERYGGPVGIELAEEIFSADSEAVLALLQAYPGDEGAEVRWRMALKGMDALLEDLGLSLEDKLRVEERARAAFHAEFRVDKRFEEQLAQRYRRESRELEALMAASPDVRGPARPGLLALRRRGERLRPVVERLRQTEREGRLTVAVERLAESFLHMHVNRLLSEDQRAQELILHDFLVRLYRSRLARMKKDS
ncbi:lanthionine biosynthesis protein [Cystobacter fuscus]|uniref:Lanthionine biosynthesis protein n=1 Tax=Cystobacter fuscus TaxID=43 RepID=A0A250J6Q6_9BACT|nr:lantibiotic dehydratase [Cystobacter fuscus]ATB39609.1 lanthionine biosynthesis protein [Cystobacter fuscus]